ncbi:MAG: ferritin-like domain-containing protein, partial [Actinomycetota bacterium]|nr:ferritin-like domain-containing protein [Actinomycetota bacterium]
MEKQTINVPGVEEFAQPRTRRDFFKVLAAASVGATVSTSLFTSKTALAQIGGTQGGDAGILNFALTLEFLERDFYQMALERGVLSGQALGVVSNLRDHEQAHVDFLTTALQGAGATPAPKPEFTFPPEALASQEGVIQLASVLEPTGVGAYLGAGPMIQN